uniref:Uncharacterized protein n=1 Tax=Hyaloperonospora arabidopsidis (strain Emoy2) TaxID=559515 RepID=M4BFA6_HYAAE
MSAAGMVERINDQETISRERLEPRRFSISGWRFSMSEWRSRRSRSIWWWKRSIELGYPKMRAWYLTWQLQFFTMILLRSAASSKQNLDVDRGRFGASKA